MKFIKKMPQNLKLVLLEKEINSFRVALNTISNILDELTEDNHLEIKNSNIEDQKELLEMMIHLLSLESSMIEIKTKINKLVK